MDYSVAVSSAGFVRSPSKVDSSRTGRDHVSKAVTDGFVDSTSKATNATGADSTTADGKASQPKATSRIKGNTPLDSAGANNSSFGGKSGMPDTFTPGSISRSMEKLGKGSSNSLSNATARCAAFTGAPAPVRCSRSQENYFENGDLTLVDIDFDDNKATSVDALQYDTCSLFSFDNSAILNTWTNKCSEDGGGGSIKPRQTNNLETLENWDISGFDDSSPGDVHEPEVVSDEDRDVHETGNYLDDDNNIASLIKPCPADGSRKNTTQDSEGEEEEGDKTDDENLFSHPPTPVAFKDHDRASAARLAKRLYHLEGFKKTDVLRHLSKTNNFSQLVSEEYLKFFDFTDLPLEAALRSYASHVITAAVDMQDLERLLSHLAIRYHRCNPGVHKSADTCHTLACAMLLLNCDLHIQSTARKMTLLEFIVNLRDMNDGEDFPDEVLTSLYQSIKNQPLKFNTKPDSKSASQSQQQQQGQQQQQQQPGGNRKTNCRSPPTDCQISNGTSTASLALEVPDPNNIKVSKKGYVMRKCCTEPDGRKTRLGKRAWKMMYSTLRGLVLYLHTDEQRASSLKISNQRHQPQTPSFLGVSTSTTSTDANNTNNGNFICIHHSLASRASDYTKKNHVFRLQTADFAQYLIQTSSSKECHEWIEAINFAAASCSSVAAIFPAVEAKATTNLQRPMMPFAYTKLNMKEQLRSYEKMLAVVEKEVLNMCKSYQDKGTKTRRLQEEARVENYLKYEIKRYKTYIRILSEKLATLIRPETGPLAGSTIREVEESSLH